MIGSLLHTSPRAAERRLNFLVVIASAVALIVLVLLPIMVPKMLSTASATTAIKRGNEMNSCRASYRAQVDDASARLQTSRARLDVATSEGLTAIADHDDAAFRAAIAKSGEARSKVITDAQALSDTTDRYSDLVRESREHVATFLKLCRSEAP